MPEFWENDAITTEDWWKQDAVASTSTESTGGETLTAEEASQGEAISDALISTRKGPVKQVWEALTKPVMDFTKAAGFGKQLQAAGGAVPNWSEDDFQLWKAAKLAQLNREAFPQGINPNTELLTEQTVGEPQRQAWREEFDHIVGKPMGESEDRGFAGDVLQSAGGMVEGAEQAGLGMTGFLTSPVGILLPQARFLPKAAQAGISLGFATDMALHAPEDLREFQAATGRGDTAGAMRALTRGLANAGMAAWAGAHGVIKAGESVGAIKTPLEKAADNAEPLAPATAEVLREQAKKEPVIETPAPTPVAATSESGIVAPPDRGATPPATGSLAPQPVAAKPESERPLTTEGGINTGALGEMGMGGAKPAEFAPGRGTATGIKNAQVDAERQSRGQEPILRGARIGNEVTWDRAMARIDTEPGWQDRLVAELKEKPRTPSAEEIVALDHRYVDLQNEYAKATREGEQHYKDNYAEGVADAKAKTDFIEGKLAELEQVARNVGAEWGRSGQMRQRLLNEDFTLAAMESRARAAKGFEPLTEAEHAEVTALHEKLAEAERTATEAEVRANERLAIVEAEKALAEAKLASAQLPAYEPRVLQAAEKFAQFMDKKGDDALARIKARLGRTSAGIDPTILSDVGILGAAKLTRGIVDFARWTDSMSRDLGEWFREHAQEAWDVSQKMFGKDVDDFHKGTDRATKEKVKKAAADRGTIAEQRKEIADGLKEAVGDGADAPDIGRYARKIAETFIADGIREIDPLTDAVHGVLKEIIPDITRTESRDAWTRYGKYKLLDKDPVKVRLRELSTEGQKLSTIERLEAGQAGLKTGSERQPPTDAARRMQKTINELKKKLGIVTADPATQLRSALDAIHTRNKNRIADLRFENSTRTRIVRNKRVAPSDAESIAQRAEIDRLKKENEEIFGTKELTDEQRLERAIKASERAEASAEETLTRAEKGDFAKLEGKPIPASVRLDEIRARTAAIREQTKLLRDLDANLQEQRRIKEQTKQLGGIDERIEEVVRQINEGDIAAKASPDKPVLPELAQKRAELAELNKIKAKLQAAEKAPTTAEREAKAMAAVEARIEEIARQINEGDIAAKAKPGKPVSPAMQALREERAALNKILTTLRNAAKPKKTPEQIALQSLKTRLATEKAELIRRLAEGDFSPRRKPPRDIPLDEPTAAAKAEVAALREEFNKRLERHRYNLKSRLEKIWRGIKQARGAVVNIASSFDFSAPRQALVAILANSTRLLTHPVRGARMLGRPFGKMFQAWWSDKRAGIIEQRIKARPNAKSGADAMAGIEYSELNSSSFTKYEENAHSIIDSWAELPLRTGNLGKTAITAPVKLASRGVRMSNRAFITFLNSTRAELFDELLRSNFKDRAPTHAELKVIGNLVNIATGRGKIGPRTASVASEVLWAPKLLASRVQFLTGQPLWGGGAFKDSGRARVVVAKEYARAIIGGYLLWEVSQMFDEKKERKATSSDYGKIVRGNTRIDLWGGFQQVTVLGARAGTATTTTLKGKTNDIGAAKKYGQRGIWYLLADFGRSKLRPDVAAAVDIISRSDYIGNPTTPGGVAKSLLVPLPLREITDIMKAHGFTEGMIIEALGQFGAGVSNYEEKEAQR